MTGFVDKYPVQLLLGGAPTPLLLSLYVRLQRGLRTFVVM